MTHETSEEMKGALRGGSGSQIETQARAQELLAGRITEALGDHATALSEAAKASDRYARRLLWATWALVVATLALVWATLKIGGHA